MKTEKCGVCDANLILCEAHLTFHLSLFTFQFVLLLLVLLRLGHCSVDVGNVVVLLEVLDKFVYCLALLRGQLLGVCRDAYCLTRYQLKALILNPGLNLTE